MSLAPLQGRYPNQTAKSRYKCAIHLITLVVGPGRRKSLRLIHVPRRLSRFSLGLLFRTKPALNHTQIKKTVGLQIYLNRTFFRDLIASGHNTKTMVSGSSLDIHLI